jgi:putative membrane protein
MRHSILATAVGVLFLSATWLSIAHAQTTGSAHSGGSTSQQTGQSGTSGTGADTSRGTSMGADSTRGERSGASGSESGSNRSLDSQGFVKRAAQGNFAEIKVSQLAQSKAQSPEVKQFAQQMIDDHSQANSELAQLAKTKNLKVPEDADMMHKAALKMLQAKSGESFDTAYMKQMNKDHQKTIELFQAAATAPQVDKDLQAFASKLLPKLQQHEHLVTQVESKLPSRSASSR